MGKKRSSSSSSAAKPATPPDDMSGRYKRRISPTTGIMQQFAPYGGGALQWVDIPGMPKKAAPTQASAPAPAQTAPQRAADANLVRGFGNAGPITRGIADAGSIQRSVDNPGAITSFGDAGAITRSTNNYVGDLQRSVNDNSADIQRSIANPGVYRGEYAGDKFNTSEAFSQDRQRVEDALAGRINRQFGDARTAVDNQMVNRGLRPGTDSYREAQRQLADQQAYGLQSAVLGAGQEQSRLLGEQRAHGQFVNATRGQEFGQNLQAGDFANRATGQVFNQGLAAGDFANRATGQAFGQELGANQFANQAQQQNYSQLLGRAQFENAGRGQQFAQNVGAGAFANQAQGQQFGQNAHRSAFANQAQQQGYNQSLGRAQFNNAAAAQGQQMRLAARAAGINEQAALRGAGQVNVPGISTPQVGVANTDYAGLVNNNYNQRVGAVNAANQQRGQAFGGLLGFGSSLLTGGLF